LSKVRNVLGGRINLFVSSAAPIDPNMMIMFQILFSIDFVQAWGQTEAAGAITCSYPADVDRSSLGPPLWCMEMKLEDVPEMNYKATDIIDGQNCPRGELCVRGTNIFKRYFKEPEKTKETIDNEGWMHTGDIGIISPCGTAKIIDRKKNIFKLQQGEYIAPEKVENVLANCKFIGQVFVYGDSFQTYVVAVIVPKKENVMKWAEDKKIIGSFEDLCQNADLSKDILNEIQSESKRCKLSGLEMVRKIVVSPNQFTIENGSLTPTLKIKRFEAKKMYGAEIQKLYSTPLIESKEEIKKTNK
jgi:long-chain acyl-CoA synthetase